MAAPSGPSGMSESGGPRRAVSTVPPRAGSGGRPHANASAATSPRKCRSRIAALILSGFTEPRHLLGEGAGSLDLLYVSRYLLGPSPLVPPHDPGPAACDRARARERL